MQVSIGNSEILRRMAENLEYLMRRMIDHYPTEYGITDFPSQLIHEQGKMSEIANLIHTTGRNYRIKVEILNEDKTVMDFNNLQTSTF